MRHKPASWLGGAALFVAGFALARWQMASPEPPAEAECPPEPSSAEAELAECFGDLDACNEEVAARDPAADDDTAAAPSSQWDAGWPREHREPALRAAIDAAIAQCHKPWQLRQLDCGEPPCIAALRTTSPELLAVLPFVDCQPWSARYPDGITSLNTEIDCGDGSVEAVFLMSPYNSGLLDVLDDAERDAYMARVEDRWKLIQEAWACGAS